MVFDLIQMLVDDQLVDILTQMMVVVATVDSSPVINIDIPTCWYNNRFHQHGYIWLCVDNCNTCYCDMGVLTSSNLVCEMEGKVVAGRFMEVMATRERNLVEQPVSGWRDSQGAGQ